MKEIQTKADKILVVEVPKLAFYFDWKYHKSGNITIYWETKDDRIGGFISKFRFSNDFEIIGKLSELTDKDCEEFVKKAKIPDDLYLLYDYLNYLNDTFEFKTSKESFISLLQSEGVDTSKEYLIIKIL